MEGLRARNGLIAFSLIGPDYFPSAANVSFIWKFMPSLEVDEQ